MELDAAEVISDVLLRNEALATSTKPHAAKGLEAAQRCPRRRTKEVVGAATIDHEPQAPGRFLLHSEAANA